MPVLSSNGRRTWALRDRRGALLQWLGRFVVVAAFAVSMQYISSLTVWAFVVDSGRQIGDLFDRMLPPQWAYTPRLWQPLWETVNIATLGTLIAVVLSVPITCVAARNTTPHPVFRLLALLVIVVSRSVNSLIWALIIVALIGPGVLAGIVAISLRAVGFIAKLLYEAVEEINPEQVEAMLATGASRMQVIVYAILPQIRPTFVGVSVFRWDINIREATVLGLVGAGGIGFQLNSAINRLMWDRASMIFLLIIALVMISEAVSARIRQSIT